MKKTTILFLCLAFISLACLSTALVSETQVTIESTSTAEEEFAGAVYEIPTSAPARTCARVIAPDALHVRQGPSEKDTVLAWLNHNDVVIVVDKVNPNWWRIENGMYTGFVSSSYLEQMECK